MQFSQYFSLSKPVRPVKLHYQIGGKQWAYSTLHITGASSLANCGRAFVDFVFHGLPERYVGSAPTSSVWKTEIIASIRIARKVQLRRVELLNRRS
jgi:hypothetical protein